MGTRRRLGMGIAGAGLALVFVAAKPHHRRRAAPPPPPPPPPPGITLSLTAAAPDAGWTLKLANTGTDPVRIVADPRLLAFDVTNAGRQQHCALPAGMRPSTDTVHTLVVPPNRSWSAHVDPLLYCFGRAQREALAPGATVAASFGFPAGRYGPPFAVTPIGLDGGAAPARAITAPTVTLAAAQTPEDAGAPVAAADAAVEASAPSNAYPVRLKIELPAQLDASRAFERTVTVKVVNEGDRTVRTLLGPTTIGFIVRTPSGHEYHCGADEPSSAIAELVSTIPPRARRWMSVDLGAVCGIYLRKPGLYRVRPRLDTRKTTPPPGAGSFWNGETVGEPMLLRIRSGEEPAPSPHLDPVAKK
jgi:hypothetical protein